MRSVFKAIIENRQKLKDKLEYKAEKIGVEEKEVLKDSLSVYNELYKYMLSFEWLDKPKAKEKMECFIKSRFDYEVFMEKFDISYFSAKSTVKNCSKRFRSKIGENTLSLLEQGFPDEAKFSFYIHSGKSALQDILLDDFISELPEGSFETYSLEDCQLELKVYKQLSRAMLEKYLSKVDRKKMAYIRHLLEGSSKKAELLRPYLYDVLTLETSIEEVVEWEEDILNQGFEVKPESFDE